MNSCDKARFESKFVIDSETGCWIWQDKPKNTGYGQFGVAGKNKLAHRASYELYVGPIPKGMDVLHNCPHGDTKLCINPEHLYLGTDRENGEDRKMKGQMPRGIHHPSALLSYEIAQTIRSLYATGEYSQQALANLFGVERSSISLVVNKKRWVHP